MAQKKSKIGINNIVSWGATIVIVGLLFKIQHWPLGSFFITLGLGTEALLFLILGFQSEPEDVDWTRAYPELDPEYKGELPTATARPQVAASAYSNTAALDKLMTDAKIGPELIQSLGTGLRSFGEKVSSINQVADAGLATTEFSTKVKSAASKFDSLSVAFDKATANLNEMASTNIDTKGYHDQVTNLAKNLSQLNAVYELELQDSSAHLKSMNKFYQNLSLTMQNFNESLEDSKNFKDEVGRLSKNLASLNAVYGNMLSAMNQPRV
ncbi:MAG: gliding motility protein GldL [Mucilaginibacter polytrichastri]|nr:gliding motility protein GldL [Mucilaginibacter polytrichastri]